jgi:hypothetical protein
LRPIYQGSQEVDRRLRPSKHMKYSKSRKKVKDQEEEKVVIGSSTVKDLGH